MFNVWKRYSERSYSMETKHVSIRVTGIVQGVFFRDSTRRSAANLDIKGFARNEYDGSVYIEAEGTEENLEQFIKWCGQGPPHARVDRIEVEGGEMQHFSEFTVSFGGW
jgi:acylphosphatase